MIAARSARSSASMKVRRSSLATRRLRQHLAMKLEAALDCWSRRRIDELAEFAERLEVQWAARTPPHDGVPAPDGSYRFYLTNLPPRVGPHQVSDWYRVRSDRGHPPVSVLYEPGIQIRASVSGRIGTGSGWMACRSLRLASFPRGICCLELRGKALHLLNDGVADEIRLAVGGGDNAAVPGLKKHFFKLLIVGAVEPGGQGFGLGERRT